MYNKIAQVAFVGVLLFAGSSALATPKTEIEQLVKERQQGFKMMGKSMKTLGRNLKKKESADYAAMLQAAQTLLTESQQLDRRFPEGSGPETGLKMEALAAIWQPESDFSSIASQMNKDSKQLVAVLTEQQPLANVMQQVKAVKSNCGSCHKAYKAD